VVKGATTPINLEEFEIASPNAERQAEVQNKGLALAQIMKVTRKGSEMEERQHAELPQNLRTKFTF
jgi:hypothetical protein